MVLHVVCAGLGLVALALAALAVATSIPALALFGLLTAILAWLSRPQRQTTNTGRWLRAAVAALALVFGLAVVTAVGWAWQRADPPVPDAFYTAPSGADTAVPGTLLRHEAYTQAIPAGARGWRMLYATTRDDGVPAVASAVVLAPPASVIGPRPLVAWTHGTTGFATGCAPTVLPAPFPFDAAVPAVPRLLAEGWALVGTDYVGLGTGGPHPYLIGQGEGRSALDSIRAVRQLGDLTLADTTVVWGHSQGGHAALWTGGLASSYAPDVHLAGVAALAPATDLPGLVAGIKDTPVGRIMLSFVLAAYGATYPDVRFDEYVGPTRRARGMAARCLSGPGALLSVATAVTMERSLFAREPSDGPLAARLRENVPTRPIGVPVLLAQGRSDPLVLPDVQDRYVRARCDAGQAIDYRTYAGHDHLSVLADDSPTVADLVAWTRDRVAGVPAPAGCRTTSR